MKNPSWEIKPLPLFHLAHTLHLPTPRGFVITTNAFHYFLTFNDLQIPINEKLATLDINDTPCLERTASDIQQLIIAATIPQEIVKAVNDAVAQLQKECGAQVKVALRSSAVKEDGKASFAGQYRTLLNVDAADIIRRLQTQFLPENTPPMPCFTGSAGASLTVKPPWPFCVLEMIDALASGVVYTRDINNSGTDQLIICSVAGQGDRLVGGLVSPDVIKMSRNRPDTIVQNHPPVQRLPEGPPVANFAHRQQMTRPFRNIGSPWMKPQAQTLARWAMTLEAHFDHPQDIEWCRDQSGNLFLLQSRPLHSPLSEISTRETGSRTHWEQMPQHRG